MDRRSFLGSKTNPTVFRTNARLIPYSPPLENDYNLYRFIGDDNFLHDLKEGDTLLDKGFVSSTRDPFYSPGLTGIFGLILLKIKLPKDKKGIGLFIENFSLFIGKAAISKLPTLNFFTNTFAYLVLCSN